MREDELTGAVLGFPIAHSLSPKLHNEAYRLAGISGAYSAIEVRSGDLQRFMDERGKEFDYLSLTMPLKEEALLLDLDVTFDAIADAAELETAVVDACAISCAWSIVRPL